MTDLHPITAIFDAEDINIIAHGDGDGTIAAAVIAAACGKKIGKIETTQPFLVHKMPDLTVPTVIVDISIDGRNPEATLEWAERNQDQIVVWIDHHAGTEKLSDVLGNKLIHDSEAPSCPELMSHFLGVSEEWVQAANACDRPTDFEPTKLSLRYNAAFKVSLVMMQAGNRGAISEVQQAFIAELVSGEKSSLVSERTEKYPELEAKTAKAVESLSELAPEVGFVQTENQTSTDVTQVMIQGYKQYPTIVILTISAEDGQPMVAIGTSKKPDELNLVELFELGGGNPSRVVLTGKNILSVSEKLS